MGLIDEKKHDIGPGHGVREAGEHIDDDKRDKKRRAVGVRGQESVVIAAKRANRCWRRRKPQFGELPLVDQDRHLSYRSSDGVSSRTRSRSRDRDLAIDEIAAEGLTPNTLTAPAPPRSQAFPASAKSLRARARGWLARRLGGRSIGRASRAKGRPAARSPARLVPCNRDGGLESFLGDGCAGTSRQQEFAAQPMEIRVGVMLPRLLRHRQSGVDCRQRAVEIRRMASSSASKP